MNYLLDNGDKLTQENATDKEFYRKYLLLDEIMKYKIRKTMEIFTDDVKNSCNSSDFEVD